MNDFHRSHLRTSQVNFKERGRGGEKLNYKVVAMEVFYKPRDQNIKKTLKTQTSYIFPDKTNVNDLRTF